MPDPRNRTVLYPHTLKQLLKSQGTADPLWLPSGYQTAGLSIKSRWKTTRKTKFLCRRRLVRTMEGASLLFSNQTALTWGFSPNPLWTTAPAGIALTAASLLKATGFPLRLSCLCKRKAVPQALFHALRLIRVPVQFLQRTRAGCQAYSPGSGFQNNPSAPAYAKTGTPLKFPDAKTAAYRHRASFPTSEGHRSAPWDRSRNQIRGI